MSNFYDRINLQKLADRWMTSNYQGTHASFAMQLYCGTRILEAEGEASAPMWTTNGILAGDPQAPLAAKIYLQKALKTFCKKIPFLHVDLWIDGLSFDVIERDTKNAVRIAIQAYTYIKELLEEQRTGDMDILFDMQPRYKDPAYEAFVAQVKVYHKFFGNWPEHLHRDMEKAWKVSKDRLQQAKHPWQVARGPVAHFFAICKITDGRQVSMIFGPNQGARVRRTTPVLAGVISRRSWP